MAAALVVCIISQESAVRSQLEALWAHAHTRTNTMTLRGTLEVTTLNSHALAVLCGDSSSSVVVSSWAHSRPSMETSDRCR